MTHRATDGVLEPIERGSKPPNARLSPARCEHARSRLPRRVAFASSFCHTAAMRFIGVDDDGILDNHNPSPITLRTNNAPKLSPTATVRS